MDLQEEAGDEAVEAEVDAGEVEKEGQVGQDMLWVEAEVEAGEKVKEGVVILSKKMIWNRMANQEQQLQSCVQSFTLLPVWQTYMYAIALAN